MRGHAINNRSDPVHSLTSEQPVFKFSKDSPVMDTMCNEHEIHIPLVLIVADSDLKDFPLQLQRKSGGNIGHKVGLGF